MITSKQQYYIKKNYHDYNVENSNSIEDDTNYS